MSKTQERINQMLALAAVAGWSKQDRKNGGPILHAPPPYERERIVMPPADQMRGSWFVTNVRKIIRYGNRQAVTSEIASIVSTNPTGDVAQWLSQPNSELAQMLDLAPATLPDGRHVLTGVTKPEPAEAQTPVEHRPLPRMEPPPQVVSERPWHAHKGPGERGGRVYESAAVIERRWSDGTVDYRCAWEGCDYTSPIPRSVARHYGGRKDHVVVAEPGPEHLDPEYTQPLTERRTKRVMSLSAKIAVALSRIDGWQGMPEEEVARKLAEVMVPEGEDADSVGALPLTDAEVLHRIRSLVDRGEYVSLARQNDDLTDEVAKLRAREAELSTAVEAEQARVEAAMRQARDAYGNLSALRELLDSLNLPGGGAS